MFYLPESCFFVMTRIPTTISDMAFRHSCRFCSFAGWVWWFMFSRYIWRWGWRWWWRSLFNFFWKNVSVKLRNIIEFQQTNKPRCALYFVCFRDFAEHSLSDSDPSVSYSVIGMWRVRIFLTSESVELILSDSRYWKSWESEREPTLRTLVYSGSLLCKSKKRISCQNVIFNNYLSKPTLYWSLLFSWYTKEPRTEWYGPLYTFPL